MEVIQSASRDFWADLTGTRCYARTMHVHSNRRDAPSPGYGCADTPLPWILDASLPTAITALYAYNIIWNGETTSFWTFLQYAHNTYLDHSHTLIFSYWTHYKQWRLCEFVRLSCAFIIRVDSKASLTAAVVMLGSIKWSECSPYCWKWQWSWISTYRCARI